MATRVDNFAAQDALSTRIGKSLPLSAAHDGRIADEQKHKAAQEFASLLFLEVIKAMRATVPAGGLFESDSASQNIYMSLADVEVARAMVQREGIGLGKFIEKALDAYDHMPAGPLSGGIRTSLGSPPEPGKSSDRIFPEHGVPARAPKPVKTTVDTSASFSSLPVDGRITSHFGARHDPLGKGERWHKGLDIAAPAGTPVRAIAAGKVVFSGLAGGYGNLVAIDHGNGVTTRYAHNRTLLVSIGDLITPGQEIAQVGSTGRSTGPHLHFEVIRDGQAVDPLAAIANFPSVTKFASREGNTPTVLR